MDSETGNGLNDYTTVHSEIFEPKIRGSKTVGRRTVVTLRFALSPPSVPPITSELVSYFSNCMKLLKEAHEVKVGPRRPMLYSEGVYLRSLTTCVHMMCNVITRHGPVDLNLFRAVVPPEYLGEFDAFISYYALPSNPPISYKPLSKVTGVFRTNKLPPAASILTNGAVQFVLGIDVDKKLMYLNTVTRHHVHATEIAYEAVICRSRNQRAVCFVMLHTRMTMGSTDIAMMSHEPFDIEGTIVDCEPVAYTVSHTERRYQWLSAINKDDGAWVNNNEKATLRLSIDDTVQQLIASGQAALSVSRHGDTSVTISLSPPMRQPVTITLPFNIKKADKNAYPCQWSRSQAYVRCVLPVDNVHWEPVEPLVTSDLARFTPLKFMSEFLVGYGGLSMQSFKVMRDLNERAPFVCSLLKTMLNLGQQLNTGPTQFVEWHNETHIVGVMVKHSIHYDGSFSRVIVDLSISMLDEYMSEITQSETRDIVNGFW